MVERRLLGPSPFQPVLEPPTGLLQAFGKLGKIHRAFDGAAAELEQSVAAPLCIEGCGKCCQQNCTYAWDIEARFVLSFILGDGDFTRIMSLAEGWLLDRPHQLKTYGLLPGKLTPEIWAGLRDEVQWLMLSPCPFLDDTKRCIIYQSRPIACRAFGVTRIPATYCPRPVGANESESVRAYYGGSGAQKLQRRVNDFIGGLPIQWRISWFLPTILYGLGMPGKFKIMADENRIASAKLIVGLLTPNLIWQEQIQAQIERSGGA